MTTATWYYALNDQEHGPVTLAELKKLADQGRISPQTLVWQEGLADWTAAQTVKGLWAAESPAALPTGRTLPAASRFQGGPPPPPSGGDVISPHIPTPPPAPVSPPPPAPLGLNVVVRPPAASSVPAVRTAAGWESQLRLFGLPLLAAGFALVLLARGCDGIGQRYVARLQAQSQVAEAQFADKWDGQQADLERQRADAEAKSNEKLETELTEKLRKLAEERRTAQDKLKTGDWRKLAASARDAEASNRMWAFWREIFFVFGTLVLTAGLLSVGLTGTGADRWLCLTMLAILAFSIFVIGAAWRG